MLDHQLGGATQRFVGGNDEHLGRGCLAGGLLSVARRRGGDV